MDEISVSDKTSICELKDGELKCYEIAPEDFGMERCSKEDLVGGNPRENAEITLSILDGQKGPKKKCSCFKLCCCFVCSWKSRLYS